MKKSLIITGATVAALGLSLIPTWDQIVFATDGVAAVAETTAQSTEESGDSSTSSQPVQLTKAEFDAKYPETAALVKQFNEKYPDIDKWSTLRTVVKTIETKEYYTTGMGEIAMLMRDDVIGKALTAAGKNPATLTMIQKFEEAKKLPKYSSDETFKGVVDGCFEEAKSIIETPLFGAAATEWYEAVDPYLPQGLTPDMFKGKSYADIATTIKSMPGYNYYTNAAFADLYYGSWLSSMREGGYVDEASLAEYTGKLKTALETANAYVAKNPAPTAPAKVETPKELVKPKAELQKYVDSVKKSEGYKKAKALVDAKLNLERVIAKIENAGGKGSVTKARVATEDADAALAKELADAIKAVGDAMRALGVETKLGQNIDLATVSVADAKSALETVKKVDKFAAYVELVDAVAAAEAAIANGATDLEALKKATAAIKASAVKVPNTGVAPRATEAASAAQTAIFATATAAIAALIGAGIVAKREIARKAAAKNAE